LVGIESTTIENENPYFKEMSEFKQSLVHSVVNRFTTNKEKGEKVIDEKGKIRRIVTLDIFNEKAFVIASLLDPRIKTSIFEGINENDSNI